MKISDFILKYPTYSPLAGVCRLRIFANTKGGVTALATELDDNTGASVTNSIEYVRKCLLERGHINEAAVLVEHHEKGPYNRHEFSHIVFDELDRPTWHDMTLTELSQRAECPEDELLDMVQDSRRLVEEIARNRNEINPFVDLPYPEAPDVVNRRAEIVQGMVPRKELLSLIESGAGEKSFQALMRRDPSLLAEVYSSPPEEYICFSEFPVGDGFADFAIYTGRSRMDVILIEIKGANFQLVNASGYENFNAKLNEAVQQIRERLGYAYRHYAEFQSITHKIRERVEKGEVIYRASVGPEGAVLEVDPNKDIKLYGVVIGGRTSNDFVESKMRQDFESMSNPRIRIESWDTWARKLRRF